MSIAKQMNQVNNYKIHKLASLVPMANKADYASIKLSIQQNGQMESVKLWNGEIIDGRNRYKACNELGIELKVEELPFQNENEVADYVKASQMRRNLNETQKLMSAVKEQQNTNAPNSYIATSWGVSERTFKRAKYIVKEMPLCLEPLFEGNRVKIRDIVKGIEIITNNVGTIENTLKRNKKYLTEQLNKPEEILGIEEDLDLPIDYNDYFNEYSEDACDLFWERYSKRHDIAMDVKIDLAKLLNFLQLENKFDDLEKKVLL